MAQLAEQTTTEPTNKLRVGTNVAGLIGAVAIALSTLLGPAMEEILPAVLGPNTKALIIGVAMAIVGYVVIKFPSQAAAYNTLDRVNVPIDGRTSTSLRSPHLVGAVTMAGLVALSACDYVTQQTGISKDDQLCMLLAAAESDEDWSTARLIARDLASRGLACLVEPDQPLQAVRVGEV